MAPANLRLNAGRSRDNRFLVYNFSVPFQVGDAARR